MHRFPCPGTVVSVAVGSIQHVGIITDRILNGFPCVISASKALGEVREVSWNEFFNGAEPTVLGYPGSLDPSTVLSRARRLVGKQWSLVKFNCEHFVHYAHGLKQRSPQLERACNLIGFVIAAVVVGILAANRQKKRSRVA